MVYQDGAKMLTVGGVVFSNSERPNFVNASFDTISFYKEADEFFSIAPPNLTLKELKFLDANLPSNIRNDGTFKRGTRNLPHLRSDDIINYAKIYRYFPTFTEALI